MIKLISNLKVLKNGINLQILTIVLIFTSTFVRLAYGLTRNLYGSGPDSIFYIEMMESFSSNGFFSEKIPYLPFYPPAYTASFSIFPFVFSENWIVFAQIFQIFLLGLATYLLYDFLKALFSEFVGFCTVFLIALQTSWIIMPGEAMYEPFLIAILVFYLSIMKTPIVKKQISFKRILIVGFFGGYVFSVHPRSFILLIIPIVLLGHKIANYKKMATWSFGFAIIPTFFAIRNFIAIDKFTLWSSGLPSYNYGHHPDLDGNGVIEIAVKIFHNPLLFAHDSLVNSFYFFSPFSGPLARGTWFHNLSLQTILLRAGYSRFSMVLSIIIVIASVLVAILGIVHILKNRNKFNFFLGFSFLSIFLTDLLIFGDNRHRLVAQIFMYPLFSLFLYQFLQRRFPRLLSNLISDSKKSYQNA